MWVLNTHLLWSKVLFFSACCYQASAASQSPNYSFQRGQTEEINSVLSVSSQKSAPGFVLQNAGISKASKGRRQACGAPVERVGVRYLGGFSLACSLGGLSDSWVPGYVPLSVLAISSQRPMTLFQLSVIPPFLRLYCGSDTSAIQPLLMCRLQLPWSFACCRCLPPMCLILSGGFKQTR